MPSKRSKSKEREKKKRARANRNLEKYEADCEVDRERKRRQKSEMKHQVTAEEIGRKEEDEEDKANLEELEKENVGTRKRVYSLDREREAEKNRKRVKREEMRENVEAWKTECAKDKERKKREREEIKKDLERWKDVCTEDRERKREDKSKRGDVEKEYEKISQKHKQRKLRIGRTGKQKLQQNLKAKKGMRILRSDGNLIDYSDRCLHNSNETMDWKKFMKQSKKHTDIVNQNNPDLVQRLNEESRMEKEMQRQKAEKAKEVEKEAERIRQRQIEEEGGEWVYNAEYSEFYWVGEREPVNDDPEYIQLSEQELADLQRQEDDRLAAMIEEQKTEARERRRQKRKELKAAMDNPINPLPVTELSEYEKLRMSNIKEREEAMFASGFFEDINEYKRKIGFLS